MKVSRNTPDQLILDHTPWAFGILFGGIILVSTVCVAVLPFNGYPEALFAAPFLVIGTVLFKGFVQRYQVIFDSIDQTVTLRHRSLTEYRQETVDLSDVEKAELHVTQQKRSGGNGPINVFCPAIRIDGKLRLLTNFFSNSAQHRKTVDTINTWLTENARHAP